MLASDVANPQFVGAANPDIMLTVEFKDLPVKNGKNSEAAGHPVYDAVLHCVITPPGNLLSVSAIATEEHKQRFPMQWQHYQNGKGQGPAIQGTPLDEWPLLDVGQRESLKATKFYTVEQVANASDVQIQAIGMGGMTLNMKAKAFLAQAQGSAAAQQQAAENAELKARLASMEERLASLGTEKPKRVMSDAHKAAMKAGREKKAAA